ncbi:MAG: EAL domain-containing protein [Gemmatimonadaceae bacterium]
MNILVTVLIIGVLVLLYGLLYLWRRRGDAMQDMITGLPSREYFERYLQNCCTRATRNASYRFGVLLIDIEGFPELRNQLGRFSAEEILADFAQRLYAVLRPSDVLCRLEGDKFAVLLEDVRGSVDVPRVALRMHNSMKDIVTLASIEIDVVVRIGVTISHSGENVDALAMITQAQSALERARETDVPYAVFDEQIGSTAATNLQLEAELSEAIPNHELELRFQPFVDSKTRGLYGFTALVRWMHPTRGLLQAREFIEIAETSRQILQIGEWVIGECARALQAITEAAGQPLIMTVNVGALEMEKGGIAEHLATALGDHASLAKYLRVEVPADALLKPSAAIDTSAEHLSALGVGLHIDRAGTTGFPLYRAIRLGVRGARVDLSSLHGVDAVMLGRILAACRSIATEIVVEGVETPEAEALVRSLDPPVWAQGFQIAKPMTLADAIALVNAARARRTAAFKASEIQTPKQR